MSLHHNAYPCVVCPEHFTTGHELADHLATLHNLSQPWLCPECPTAFASKANLESHSAITHPYSATGGSKRGYSCAHAGCGPPLASSEMCERHKKHDHVEQAARLASGEERGCLKPGCTYTNDSYVGLSLHVLHQHAPTCESCGKKFGKVLQLVDHKKGKGELGDCTAWMTQNVATASKAAVSNQTAMNDTSTSRILEAQKGSIMRPHVRHITIEPAARRTIFESARTFIVPKASTTNTATGQKGDKGADAKLSRASPPKQYPEAPEDRLRSPTFSSSGPASNANSPPPPATEAAAAAEDGASLSRLPALSLDTQAPQYPNAGQTHPPQHLPYTVYAAPDEFFEHQFGSSGSPLNDSYWDRKFLTPPAEEFSAQGSYPTPSPTVHGLHQLSNEPQSPVRYPLPWGLSTQPEAPQDGLSSQTYYGALGYSTTPQQQLAYQSIGTVSPDCVPGTHGSAAIVPPAGSTALWPNNPQNVVDPMQLGPQAITAPAVPRAFVPDPPIPASVYAQGYTDEDFNPRSIHQSTVPNKKSHRDFPPELQDVHIFNANPKYIAYGNILRLARSYSNVQIVELSNKDRKNAVFNNPQTVEHRINKAIQLHAEQHNVPGGEGAVREWIIRERANLGIRMNPRKKRAREEDLTTVSSVEPAARLIAMPAKRMRLTENAFTQSPADPRLRAAQTQSDENGLRGTFYHTHIRPPPQPYQQVTQDTIRDQRMVPSTSPSTYGTRDVVTVEDVMKSSFGKFLDEYKSEN